MFWLQQGSLIKMRPKLTLNGEETQEEAGIESRPKRIPISGNRDILAVKNIPTGKVGRWVNDVDDRVLKFRQGGWEFVTDKSLTVGEKTVESSSATGATISRQVGTKKNNEPLIAYLMVIAREWYDEDQARKQEEVDSSEESIYENLTRKRDNQYGKFETTFN
jgi:hypothetical protein